MYICKKINIKLYMKKVVVLSLLVVSFLSLESCKKDKDSKSEDVETIEEVKQNFSVKISASAAKKDDFAVYFTEDNTVDFKGENALWGGIQGGNLEEVLDFELAEDKYPTNIRLDFGLNKEQDSVVVKSVELKYASNSFIIRGSDFFTYFIKDDQFKFNINQNSGTLTLYKKGNEYKTPYFYPTQATNDVIKKITSKM